MKSARPPLRRPRRGFNEAAVAAGSRWRARRRQIASSCALLTSAV
jgi:hypothetical protein